MMRRKDILLEWIKIRHFILFFALFLAVSVGLSLVFYWDTSEVTEKVIVERVKSQELTLVDSGALSIEDFIKELRTELLFLAKNEGVANLRNEKIKETFSLLSEHLSDKGDILASIALVNKEGQLVWGVNTQNNQMEKQEIDVSDRDYFLWAQKQKNADAIYLSEPIISRGGVNEGKQVVLMAVPLFPEGDFNGLVLASFGVSDLIKKYILPLSSSPSVRVSLANQKGVIIGSSVPHKIGTKMSESLPSEGGALKSLAEIFKNLKKGALIFEGYPNQDLSKSEKVITAYAPIVVDGSTWVLFVATPYDEAAKIIWPIRKSRIFLLALALFCLLVGSLALIVGIRLIERNAFLDGFRDGRDKVKKAKKS